MIKTPEAASFHVGGFIRRKVPFKNNGNTPAYSSRDEFNSIIPVETPAAEIGGIIKSVHYTADVFVLPDYQWILKDLPGELLRPPKVSNCVFIFHNSGVNQLFSAMFWGHQVVRSLSQSLVGSDLRQQLHSHSQIVERNGKVSIG